MIFRILLLSLTYVIAGEHTLEKGDVVRTATVEVTVLPDSSLPLKISPEEWTDFTILSALEHGKKVVTGEALITFKNTAIEETVADLKEDLTLKGIELDLKKKELEREEILTPLALTELERDHTRDKDDLTYYVENEFPRRKETYDKFLESIVWDSKNAQEELTQLRAMYEEDDLTEETEEIILKRAEYMAELSKWRVEVATEEFGRINKVKLPRSLEDRLHAQEADALSYEEQKRTIPLDLEKLRLEINKQEIELGRLEKKLIKLEHDLGLMTLTADESGIFFYGVVKNGNWEGALSTGKFMRQGGKVPPHKEFACIVPESATAVGYAQVESKKVGSLKPALTGFLKMHEDEGTQYPVSCKDLGSLPLSNGKFLVSFNLPNNATIPFTLGGKALMLISEKKDLLRIPKKALRALPDGTYRAMRFPPKPKEKAPVIDAVTSSSSTPLLVEPAPPPQEEKPKLKPQEKKKEKPKAKKVVIEVGLFGDDYVEILSGLSEGDVIETP